MPVSVSQKKTLHPEEPVRNIHDDLILRAAKGDQNAMKELYRLYSKAMFNTALRIVSDRMEAEDVLQESFISAFKEQAASTPLTCRCRRPCEYPPATAAGFQMEPCRYRP